MSKFKTGDRVKRISDDSDYNNNWFKIGYEGIVKVIDDRDNTVNLKHDNGMWVWQRMGELKLVSTNTLIGDDGPPKYWYIKRTPETQHKIVDYINKRYKENYNYNFPDNYIGYIGHPRGSADVNAFRRNGTNTIEITYEQFKRWFLNEESSADNQNPPFDIDNFWIRSDKTDPRWGDYIQYLRERFDKPESFKGAAVKHCYTVVKGNYYYANAYPRPETLREASLDTFFNYINNQSGESPQNQKDEIFRKNQSECGPIKGCAIKSPECTGEIATASRLTGDAIKGRNGNGRTGSFKIKFSPLIG